MVENNVELEKGKTVIIGRPGTGKTYSLLKQIETFDPTKTIFISFTRAAIREAKKRAEAKWGIKPSELKYFRTIHSLLSMILGLSKEDFLTEEEIEGFFKTKKIEYIPNKEIREVIEGEDLYFLNPDDELTDGNKLIALLTYIENIECRPFSELSMHEQTKYISDKIEGLDFKNEMLKDNVPSVREILNDFEDAKNGRYYYTDILLDYLKNPKQIEDATVLVVDEFQDLSPLMYRIIKELEKQTQYQFYAGDPNQAIYTFIGANPRFLLDEYKSADRQINLRKSYRMKNNIWQVARDIINTNGTSEERIKEPLETEAGGEVRYYGWDDIDSILEELKGLPEGKACFILTRTNARKELWKKSLNEKSIPYRITGLGKNVWTRKLIAANNFIYSVAKGLEIDKETVKKYIRDCLPASPFLKRGAKAKLKELWQDKETISMEDIQELLSEGYKLNDITKIESLKLAPEEKSLLQLRQSQNPGLVQSLSISLGTIHAHKGMEADIVVYDTKLSKGLSSSIEHDPEKRAEEARIAYVAITRAKEKLVVYGSNIFLERWYV